MGDELINSILVELCAEFIDWPKRAAGENRFFAKMLRRYGCRDVFESSLGDGCDVITLMREGFKITANEIDHDFISQAVRNITREGLHVPPITNYNWRDTPSSLDETHDAVLCLGNSLTYMMTREEQEKVVYNFKDIVRSAGIVVIDHRNYDYILAERDYILKNPQGNFRYSRQFYYCGETVDGYPVEINDDLIVFEYLHKPTGKSGRLEFYPLRRQEVIDIMRCTGLEIKESYGDFELGKIGDVDFYQHVGVKK